MGQTRVLSLGSESLENVRETVRAGLAVLSHLLESFWVDTADLAPHSSTLAWKMLWTEEPGRLQSMGSLRVRYD